MIWYALISIFALFIVFALLKKSFQNIMGIRLCAICAAVSLTWIIMLALYLTGIFTDRLLIGILMGQSVVGLMYLFEAKAKKHKKNYLLPLKVFIILFGTFFVYILLDESYAGMTGVLLLTTTTTLLFVLLLIYLIIRKNKKKIKKNRAAHNKEMELLKKKFENCCD